ncbi:hypothetical protein F5Y19DRAFT_412921 [Xylariaceae sp. FL1651]|nr:hypothetical protein F5Y19DRAFT_412921 [Xylariaceae sp. FL1651]
MRTFITDACALPPAQAVPVLHVLLDNNASVDDGWGPGGGALFAAVIGGQPVEILARILSKVTMVCVRHGLAAIRRGDVDIVKALFMSETASAKFIVEPCAEAAKNTRDVEIIAIVQKWAQEKVGKQIRGKIDEWKKRGAAFGAS